MPTNQDSPGNTAKPERNSNAESLQTMNAKPEGLTTTCEDPDISSPTELWSPSEPLPIEIVSFCDRFIDSLRAKVYDSPPTIDNLSELFQDFYLEAELYIATHLQAAALPKSKQTEKSSSKPGIFRSGLPNGRSLSRDTTGSHSSTPEQQLLTPQEIIERKLARRAQDRKALRLSEAIEKLVCERIYDRIWRHRSTIDEVQDDKLRSKTAALSVVGIGLDDLGVQTVGNVDHLFGSWDASARECLVHMSKQHNPYGKLRKLAAAHKYIVEYLSSVHQSSSSADEILPMLIYILITIPPPALNVISDLRYIQRFRGASRLNGEAAYCLTNLEAAITFLETVDLATLRAEERPAVAPRAEAESVIHPPLESRETPGLSAPSEPLVLSSMSVAPVEISSTNVGSRPAVLSHRRRMSDLLQPPSLALGAAGDVVRNTADQGLKTIGTALDHSFSFMFGKVNEQRGRFGNGASRSLVLPETLSDARKLIEPEIAEDTSLSVETTGATAQFGSGISNCKGSGSKSQDALLDAIAGRKHQPEQQQNHPAEPRSTHGSESLLGSGAAAVESMKNIGNNFNPLRGFSTMNVMRGFGRTTSSTSNPTLASIPASPDVTSSRPRSISTLEHDTDIKILPPIQKFMVMANPQDLKVGDIASLLEDYQRLATALSVLGAY